MAGLSIPIIPLVANTLYSRFKSNAADSPGFITTYGAPIPMKPVSGAGSGVVVPTASASGGGVVGGAPTERTALLGGHRNQLAGLASPNAEGSIPASAFEPRNLLILCVLGGAAGLSLWAVWPELQLRTGALYLIAVAICAVSAHALDVVVMSLSVSLPPAFLHHSRYSASFLTLQAAAIGQAVGSLLIAAITAAWGVPVIQRTIAFPLIASCAVALVVVIWFYSSLTIIRPSGVDSPYASLQSSTGMPPVIGSTGSGAAASNHPKLSA